MIALDILELKPISGVEFLKLDFLDQTAPDRLKALLGVLPVGPVRTALEAFADLVADRSA